MRKGRISNKKVLKLARSRVKKVQSERLLERINL